MEGVNHDGGPYGASDEATERARLRCVGMNDMGTELSQLAKQVPGSQRVGRPDGATKTCNPYGFDALALDHFGHLFFAGTDVTDVKPRNEGGR
jgi:hypothetical protein